MPRRSKGTRLYFRPAKKGRKPVYVIRDGQREFSTGTSDCDEAETRLKLYLLRKERGPEPVDPASLTVAQALVLYGEKRAGKVEDPARIGYAIAALDAFWGDLPVREITSDMCELYCEKRGVSHGTLRRELGCLKAAINFALPPGLARPAISMPERPPAKDRWLTRDEAARLLRAARRHPETRHLTRFILLKLYTGSRKTVLLRLKYMEHAGGGWVDLDRGFLYRKPRGSKTTKKRAPSVRIPKRLLAHLKRWRKTSASGWVVEYDGAGVASVKTAWKRVVKEAKLPGVTPHTLRHTAVTWAMQVGANEWEVCGFFGMSMRTLEETYAHHHPDFQANAVDAANRGGRRDRDPDPDPDRWSMSMRRT